MEKLNVLPPSIEPHASGHIPEQIKFVEKILEAGYAYVSEGSVYFDVEKYNKDFHYGKLSGRNIEELLETTRELDGQSEKRRSVDFALWKKAAPEHIMRWESPWSDGFPGWHMECSAMGTKYLGEEFDIHGGGMDLMFPHHECEIAQSTAALGHESVHYWVHNNMITIDGQKMGKSLGNFITLDEFFNGTSHKNAEGKELIEKAYSPMTIITKHCSRQKKALQDLWKHTQDLENLPHRTLHRWTSRNCARNAKKHYSTTSTPRL